MGVGPPAGFDFGFGFVFGFVAIISTSLFLLFNIIMIVVSNLGIFWCVLCSYPFIIWRGVGFSFSLFPFLLVILVLRIITIMSPQNFRFSSRAE